jgi:hypothetical protein
MHYGSKDSSHFLPSTTGKPNLCLYFASASSSRHTNYVSSWRQETFILGYRAGRALNITGITLQNKKYSLCHEDGDHNWGILFYKIVKSIHLLIGLREA